MSRTSKSIRNVIIALIGQVAVILMGFVARKLFILFLNAEYLGLNGLFSSVLTVLSLVELGLGPAMIFSLYKPLAENNILVCRSLMSVYRKAYRIIGFTVLGIGCCLTPFITNLIKEIPENISGIHIIYVLFVINVSISYFFSYKRSFIIASQNQYLIEGVHTISYLILNIIQILIIAATRNYFLFLGMQIIFTFLENFILSKLADKSYPWLISKEKHELPEEKKLEVIRNVKAMIFHKIGGIVMDATDNLLISKFFGLLFLGIYSNYLLILNAIKSITQTFFTGIMASIGDFGIQKTPEESYQLYKKVQFFNFWLTSFCSICAFILINPFIETIWLGSEYLINLPILIVIILNFYINSMRKTILTFKEAYGLPWYDRYKPIIGAVVNLVFSIWFANIFGVIGIFIGTTVTQLLVNVWFEAMVVFKHGFQKRLSVFLKEYLAQTGVFFIVFIITILLCSLLPMNSIAGFIFSCVVCLVVPNTIMIIIYHKTEEFKYIKNIVWNLLFEKVKSKMRR